MTSGKDAVWERTMLIMEKKLNNPTALDVWLKQIHPVEITGETATLSVPTNFYWEIIKTKFGSLISESLEEALGFAVDVNLIIDEDIPENEISERQPEITKMPIMNNDGFTFENYVVGKSNELAYAASIAVANNLASAYNPLFIYGGSGLGKTHLMYSIVNTVKTKNPDYSILYVSCEDFTNELIYSIKTATMENFREKYRQIDLLLVDDIQFIGKKIQTQEEFFHTFDFLKRLNKQIVLASDRPPKEIEQLTDRLKGRFEEGLMVDIQPPDFELRMAIVRKKAENLNLQLPDEVVEFLADKLKYTVRQLEGALKKILMLQMISKTPPTLATAQSAVADVLNENEPISSVIDKIITEVGRYYSVSVDDMKSSKRMSNITNARQVAMYLIRELCSLSLPQIGEQFQGKDHSTVHHSIRKVEEQLETNNTFRNQINDLINAINEK